MQQNWLVVACSLMVKFHYNTFPQSIYLSFSLSLSLSYPSRCSPAHLTRNKCMVNLLTMSCLVSSFILSPFLPKSSLSNSSTVVDFCAIFDFPTRCFPGPDICGPGTKKVHVIFGYKGKNHLIKKEIRCKVSQPLLDDILQLECPYC